MLTVAVRYTPRLSAAEQQLIALPNRLKNLAPLMTLAIAPAAERMLLRHWESKGAAFGHSWAPLAASTIAARAKRGTLSKGILRDTDHLFRALFRSLSSNRLRPIANGLRLAIGADAIFDALERAKFRWHQLGTSKMPARQAVPSPLPRSFRDEIRALVHDFIATGRVRGDAGRFVSVS